MMKPDQLTALQRLREELERWNCHNSPTEGDPVVEPVSKGSPVHNAILALEASYEGPSPPGLNRLWRRFYNSVKAARESTDTALELAAIDACDEFRERIESEISQQSPDEPPADILNRLGPKVGGLFCELWRHGSVTYKHLETTVWRDKPIQPGTIDQAVKRLQKELVDTPYRVGKRNRTVTLEK